MPGLVPGIHVLTATSKKDVDGRVKPGHDEGRSIYRVASPIDAVAMQLADDASLGPVVLMGASLFGFGADAVLWTAGLADCVLAGSVLISAPGCSVFGSTSAGRSTGRCGGTLWKDDYNIVRPHSGLGNLTPAAYAKAALPKSNGTGRCAALRAPRPVPLLHRAKWAQINSGLYPSLDERRASGHGSNSPWRKSAVAGHKNG